MPNKQTEPDSGLKANVKLLLECGYFDPDWYVEQYPDVTRLGLDPAVHFLKYGWRMKRNPSPRFHTASYLQRYQDVARSGVNPLLHYLSNGKAEGRTAPPVPAVASKVNPPEPLVAKGLMAAEQAGAITAEQQLQETQRLLEHYFIQYETLRSQLHSQGHQQP